MLVGRMQLTAASMVAVVTVRNVGRMDALDCGYNDCGGDFEECWYEGCA